MEGTRVLYLQETFALLVGYLPLQLSWRAFGFAHQLGRPIKQLDALTHRKLQHILAFSGLRNLLNIYPEHRLLIQRHTPSLKQYAQHLSTLTRHTSQWRSNRERDSLVCTLTRFKP